MSNLNQPPKSSNTIIYSMKQMELAIPVEPHSSHVALITNVFKNI